MGMDQFGGRALSLVWIALGVAACGDSRECADAIVDAREARGSSDFSRLRTATVQAKAFCNGRYATEIAAWEKQLASAPAPIAAPAAAPPPAATPASAVAKFLAWVKANRSAPQKIEEEPFCDKGECTANYSPDDELLFTATYYPAVPAAARFTTHVAGDVSCVMLGATSVRAWGERPGIVGAAGESCVWREGSLKGQRAIIEKNRLPQGGLRPGIHVYSEEYLRRDLGFARAIKVDEGR